MVDTDDTRRTTEDDRWTMPGIWHKLPQGELKNCVYNIMFNMFRQCVVSPVDFALNTIILVKKYGMAW